MTTPRRTRLTYGNARLPPRRRQGFPRLASLGALLLWPCRLVFSLITFYRKATKEAFERKQQRQAWPEPLPIFNSIARATSDVKPSITGRQKTSFFSLPLELRLAVYDNLFSLSDVHLITFRYHQVNLSGRESWKSKHFEYHLESLPCLHMFVVGSPPSLIRDAKLSKDMMCACLTGFAEQRYAMPQYRDSGLGVLELMLVCKEFYHDILAVLHTHRTFQIDNLDTVVLASLQMPTRHFNRITSLRLNAKYISRNMTFMATTAHFPPLYQEKFASFLQQSQTFSEQSSPSSSATATLPHPKTPSKIFIWPLTCSIISSMQSLKKLRIQLCREAFAPLFVHAKSNGNGAWSVDDSFVFKPLVEIARRKRDLDLFQVEVDWPAGEEKWAGKNRAFEVVRVEARKVLTMW